MRWTLTLIILLSLLVPLMAAGACGNGVCSGDKNCSTCSLDCGKCSGGSCSLDNDCSSGICCNGVCSNSCVAYSSTANSTSRNASLAPSSSGGGSPYISYILATGTYSVTLGVIFIAMVIFVVLERRKKPAR